MANQKNISTQIGIDIDLLLGQIADKKLFDPIKKHLDKLVSELSHVGKIPLDMQLDLKPLEKEFNRAMRQIQQDFQKPLSALGTGLGEGNIAKELKKRLAEAGDTVVKDGKIVRGKLREILQGLSDELKLKGSLDVRGKNPLKEYLALADKSLDEANKSLSAKSKEYSAIIRDITKQQKALVKAEQSEFTGRVKQVSKLETAGKKRTQADIDKSTAIFQGTDTSSGTAATVYQQQRRLGSGASKEDLVKSASAYKQSLVSSRAALEDLQQSGMVMSVTDAELAARTKELDIRIKELNREISGLTGNYKQAELSASQMDKLTRQLTASLEAQRIELRKVTLIAKETGDIASLEKRIAVARQLADTYRALGQTPAGPGYTAQAKAVDEAIAKLQVQLDIKKRDLEISKKIAAAQEGEKTLASESKFLEGKQLLAAIERQAKLTETALVAMDKVGFDSTEVELYRKRLEELRGQAKATADALKPVATPKASPDALAKAQVNAEKAQAKLAASEEQVQMFGSGESPRARLRMIEEQKRAVEGYITALQHLANAERNANKDNASTLVQLNQRKEQLKDLEGQLKGFDNILVQTGRAFQNFLRYAIIYQVLYQVQSAIQAVASEIINLQDALTQIKAVTLSTTGQMEDIEAAIKSVAETTAFTTDEIAKGGQTLVQAGVEVTGFAKALRATANLASATGATFQQGAEVMTTFMNVFDSLDPDTIADKLTNAVNISKLNIQDLTSIANYLLSTTESFNISLDNTLAAATTLRNAGFKASTIATGTRQAILELLSPDAKTLKALQARYAQLGIDMTQEAIAAMFTGFREAKNPLVAALNELEKLGFGGLGDKQLSRVFDIRAESVIRSLIQNKDELLANEVALQKAGTAAEGARIRLDSLKNSFQNLGESIITFFYDESKGLVSGIQWAVDGLTKLVNKAKELATEVKAATGESGSGTAITTGIAAAAASLAKGRSILSSVGLGIVASVAQEFAVLLGAGSKAVTIFTKAVEDAAIAIAVGSLFGKGATIGGAAKTATSAAKTGFSAVKTGASAALGAAGEFAAGGIGAAAGATLGGLGTLIKGGAKGLFTGVKAGVKAGGRFILGANPWAAAAGAVLLAIELYNTLNDSAPDADKAKAQTDALAQKAQALKAKAIADKETQAADAAAKKQLDDFQQVIQQTEKGFDVFTSPEQLGKIKGIMQQAASGVIAIGSQSLEAVVAEISKATGIAESQINRSALAAKLQELNATTQQAEAVRAQYIEKLNKAYSDYAENENNAAAKEVVDQFKKLNPAEQQFLMTQLQTAESAKQLISILNKTISVHETLDTYGSLVEAEIENLKPLLERLKNGEPEDQRKAKLELEGKLGEAVAEGQTALVKRMTQVFRKVLDPSLIEGVLKAVEENAKARALKEANDVIREAQASLPAAPQAIPTAAQFEAAAAAKKVTSTKNAAQDQLVSGNLEEYLQTRLKELISLGEEKKAIAEAGKDTKGIDEKIKAKRTEILNLNDTIAKLTGESAAGEEKLAALQRSFYAGDVRIKELQDDLARVHGAKLHDAEKEAEITKEIYKLKVEQLAQEKSVLGANLAKQAEPFIADAKSLKPEDLVKTLSGPAGAEVMKNNKDLADSYKALATVVNEEANLREKLVTDLDNIQRKELEAKKALVQKDYDKITKKKDTLEERGKSIASRLQTAQEKLAAAYEKRAELEQSFKSLKQELSGKKVTTSDLQDQLKSADQSGSKELALQTAQQAVGLKGQGISKSDVEDIVSQAEKIALGIQDQQILRDQYQVNSLLQEQRLNSNALAAATTSQTELKSSLDGLTAKIGGLQTATQNEVSTLDQSIGTSSALEFKALPKLDYSDPKFAGLAEQIAKEKASKSVPAYAKGGLVTGPGSSTSDSILASVSNNEFVQPQKAVTVYGTDFMEKIRNLQVDPNLIKAVAARPLGGVAAQEHKLLQPAIFKIGDAMISTQAQPDAVKQFQSALRIQAVKTGRTSR